MRIAYGLHLAPAFEGDLDQVLTESLDALDANHAFTEAPALQIQARAVELTRLVTVRDGAFTTMLTPGQQGAGADISIGSGSLVANILRNLLA